jgi:hypothetical protein
MSAEIFQFSTATKRSATIKTSTRVGEDIGENIPAEIDFRSSEWKARKAERAAYRPVTAINSDLRKDRREVWRAAEELTRYWRARMEFESAAASSCLPRTLRLESDNRHYNVGKYREALVAQLLTPASDLNCIKWKQTTFAAGQHKYTDIKPERIERAIADDIAWLAAHPTKRSNTEAVARRREFREAMRGRIRKVAVTLKLSDDEIRRPLSLRHKAIAEFFQVYAVNLKWLYEGVGPMFNGGPVSLSARNRRP